MSKQRIHKYYKNVVAEDFLMLFNYDNIMQLPQIRYAVVSNTDSDYLLSKKQGVNAFAALSLITGQKSISTRARKSIAAFKLRQGSFLGCKITVRRNVLDVLLDHLMSFVFTYRQNYGVVIASNKNKKQNKNTFAHHVFDKNADFSLNVGIRKLIGLPSLEKFFVFFESLKGCNLCFILSCPCFKDRSFHFQSSGKVLSLPQIFLNSFQIPTS